MIFRPTPNGILSADNFICARFDTPANHRRFIAIYRRVKAAKFPGRVAAMTLDARSASGYSLCMRDNARFQAFLSFAF